MRARTRDLITAAAFLVAAVAMARESMSELYSPVGASIANDPVFYPRILLAVIAILAGTLFVSAWRTRQEPVRTASLHWRAAGTMMVAATLYVAAMPWLGFVASTAVFLAIAPVLMGFRRWVALALVAVVMPLVCWLVFVRLIRIPLPAATLLGLD